MNFNNTRSESEATIVSLIDHAEIVSDPLDHILERTAIEPGTPFQEEVLAALARLRRDNPGMFENLRNQLKRTGCRVVELDKALAKLNEPTARDVALADKLIEIAASAQLFRAPDGIGYADIQVEGHRETWPIRSKTFQSWLRRAYFEQTRRAPTAEAFASALGVIEAKAHYDSPEQSVFLRVGQHGDRYYIDLCDDRWRAIEIDADGWRVVSDPPIRFRRAAGMRPLPLPQPGGSIDRLRSYLNVMCEADFVLVVCWMLASLYPQGSYPILALSGEQGSAKSTFAKVLKALIDPNTAPNSTRGARSLHCR
jgi:hypothetical protein